jgi:uncharacterized membrane protein YsdA (DUF1294 family)
MDPVPLLVMAFVAVNVWTIAAFWRDKRAAVMQRRRVREADLLSLALLGGSPGALLARQMFRHKTRKEPFSTQLFVVVALQIGALVGLCATLV